MRDDFKKQIDEPFAIAERYARRSVDDRSFLRPEVWHGVQERQRAFLDLFARYLGWKDLANLKLTEVGYGSEGNLLDFLRFGFSPQNLCGIELLPERATAARRMWQWVKPGGGIFWYDFIYNNPANPDVHGVPVIQVRELFPAGKMIVRRVTLAPPISRRVCRIHPVAYHIFNAVPWLRTHVLCWIGK